jgi:hypothetical protein
MSGLSRRRLLAGTSAATVAVAAPRTHAQMKATLFVPHARKRGAGLLEFPAPLFSNVTVD